MDCTMQVNTAFVFAYACTQELHLNENLIPSNEERCASLQNENEYSGHGQTLAKMHCSCEIALFTAMVTGGTELHTAALLPSGSG